jgi:hypothetical protein
MEDIIAHCEDNGARIETNHLFEIVSNEDNTDNDYLEDNDDQDFEDNNESNNGNKNENIKNDNARNDAEDDSYPIPTKYEVTSF